MAIPLTELSDKELKEKLAGHATNVSFSYNSVIQEIERRKQQRNADRVFRLSMVAVCVSVAALVTSVLVALFK